MISLQHVPGDKSSNVHALLDKSSVLGNCDEHCTVGLHFSLREHSPLDSSTRKKSHIAVTGRTSYLIFRAARGHSTTTWTRSGEGGVSQKSMLVHVVVE